MAGSAAYEPHPRGALSSSDPGQDRTLVPDAQEPKPAGELVSTRRPGSAAFIDHYNHWRYHDSLENLTPAHVYFGSGRATLLERARIKRNAITQRRLVHQKIAA
jgi:hypothetical protein